MIIGGRGRAFLGRKESKTKPISMVLNRFPVKMYLSKCKFSHAVHLLCVACVYYEKENVCIHSCVS